MRAREVVVISGASSGIGRAAAERFAHRGARLVLNARAREPLEIVAAACRERGAEVLVVPGDIADPEAVQAVVDEAVDTFGRIDTWVCSAGVVAYGKFEDLPPATFRRVIDVNFFGQVNSARAVLPQFRRQGTGTLILVGSLYSVVSSPLMSSYVSSKHALRGFARSLRQEFVGHRGIRVSAVHPATIDTPIYQRAANYTGRGAHPMIPLVAPERVAASIVRAARHPRPEVFVGRVQRLAVPPLHDIAPRVYDRLVGPALRLLSLRGTSTISDGNLFTPTEDAPRTGGWRSAPARITAISSALVVALWLRRRSTSRR